MPVTMQEERSNFKSSQTRSVQVIGGDSNVGVGELSYDKGNNANTNTSNTSSYQQRQQRQESVSSNVSSHQNQSSRREHDISSSTSASSINSDSTLKDFGISNRFGDDFTFRPSMNFDSSKMLTKISDFEDVSRDVYHVNDGDTFEMKLEVQEFKPEEIQVKISDRLVTIEGKQEDRQNESSFRSRQFSKKFTIPEGVKAENITCTFTAQGVLKISAPIEQSQSSQSAIKNSRQEQANSNNSSTSSTTSKLQQQRQQQSSINSEISSLRDGITRGFDDEFILRPRMAVSSLMNRKESEFEHISKEICNVNDGKKFEMKLEVKNFKPEEIEVKITKNLVKIDGKHESEFASRSFHKEFTVPFGVKCDSIQCSINEDGILTISAPVQPVHEALTSGASKTSKTTEQEVKSSQKVSSVRSQQQQQTQQQTQQVQQQKQTQQQALHSDSTSSINSNTSSIRDAVRKFDDDFILRPIMDFENLMGRDSRFEDVSKQICQLQDDKKFEMKLDVPDFKPEELQVKISNNMVTIEGTQKTEFSSRQFFKKFSIPQGVKPDTITSSLNPKGVLTISAPIQNQQQQAPSSTGISDTKTTSSTRVEQQSVRQHQQQQQANHSDSTNSINSNASSVRRFDDDLVLRPIMDFENLFAKDSRFEDVSKQLCQSNDEKKFEMKLDVPDFKPEELEVKISNNMVTIQGKQEMKAENNFSSRQFFKKFSIPQNVKPETITSSLSPKGVLTISAPVQTVGSPNQIQSQQAVNTSSKNVSSEQEVSSSRVTNVKSLQQQHQTSLSDSTSSVNSSLASSIRDASRRFDEDFMIRPIMDFDALLAKESHFEDISKQLCQVNEGKKFETKLDVPDFKPEELQIKISNNMVTIEGKQKSEFSSRQFSKKFSIPQGVKPESITSSLSPKGVLTISAPIENQTSSNLSRNEQLASAKSSTTSSTRKEVQQQVNASNTSNLRREIDTLGSNNDSSTSLSSIMNKAMNTSNFVFKPKMHLSDSLMGMNSQFEDVSKEVCHVNDGKHFEMKLEVQEFKPEEIDVKIANNMVTIEGKQEMKEENNFRSRQFCKKFSIPQGVKAENITCSLSTDGRLTISAPIDQSQKQLTSALTSGLDNNSTVVASQNQQSQQVQQQSGQTSTSSVKKVSTFSSTSSTTSSGQF